MEVTNAEINIIRNTDETTPVVETRIPKRSRLIKMMKINITTATDFGSKRKNEDRYSIEAAKEVPRFGPNSSVYLYGVFDGHAGNLVSDFAKDNLLEKIVSKLRSEDCKNKSMSQILIDSFREIQEDMKASWTSWPKILSSGRLNPAGSTATIVVIVKDLLYVAHVGDTSVLYAHKENDSTVIRRLTKLHKPSDPTEAKAVKMRGGVIASGRVCRDSISPSTGVIRNRPCLAMTRSLGNFWSYSATTGMYRVSPIPDVSVRRLDRDCYILIATDGLTDIMSDKRIMKKFIALDNDHCKKMQRENSQLQESSKARVNFAKEIIAKAKSMYTADSSLDNMTVVTLKVSFVFPTATTTTT